jgi:Flp pilus assembly protein TadD
VISWKQLCLVLVAGLSLQSVRAGDLKITLPKKSEMTPVQRLNREGVDALRKNQYEKARALFYKAYLYDPDDPFTLNNLGYIAELDGQVERAQQFYELAAKQPTDAIIDKASIADMKGQSFNEALAGLQDVPMQINRANVEAIRLVSEGRAPEADLLLQRTLRLGPHNVFTLNNMGVAKEMEGEFEEAIKYYNTAAGEQSSDPVIVTLNKAWRGKPVAEMAASNAKKLEQRLEAEQTVEARVQRLNLQGVSAINRNDWHAAREDFMKAYSMDPSDAFCLNNLGYVSEMEGDRETAQFFYEKAQKAQDAGARVGLATRHTAEGMPLLAVAQDSDQKVEDKVEEAAAVRRRQSGPIELRTRDNKPIDETPQAAPQTTNPPVNQIPDPPEGSITPINPVPRPPQ